MPFSTSSMGLPSRGFSGGNSGGSFLFGTPQQRYQQTTLGQEQQDLYSQLLRAGQGSGAGGAFGAASDYYRDNLSNDSQTANMMMAPELRRFQEDIVPGLAEQFAGMGSGGLSSSGFRNAGIRAATDLSERLGLIRANLRQQSAQGLSGIGQQGLGSFNENIIEERVPGFLETFAGSAGKGFGEGLGKAIPGLF